MNEDDLKVLVYTQSYGIIDDRYDSSFYDTEHEYDLCHIQFVNRAFQKVLSTMDFSAYKDVKILVETKEELDVNCSPFVQANFFIKFANKYDALAFKLKK